MKGMDKKTDEGILRWFSYVQKMENNRIDKKIYVGESAGSWSVDRPRNRWIDIVFKEREVWISGKQGEWCKIEVNGGSL